MIPVWCSVVANVKLGFEYARVIEKYFLEGNSSKKIGKILCSLYFEIACDLASTMLS